MSSPTISIVTPSYNQGKYLEETIQSVVSQREHIHEYFVLDGGSKDHSVDIIQKYADRIDWWVSEKDKGQSDAIAKGFARCTGDYLAWINSDDVYLPNALGLIADALRRHPQWDILTGYHVAIDANSLVTKCHRHTRESALRMRWGAGRVCQQTCFFRRSLYEKIGGVNLALHYVMDTDLWYRFCDAGAVWGHVPRYLAGYRWHTDAKGSDVSPFQIEGQSHLSQQYPHYRPAPFKRLLGNRAYQVHLLLTGQYYQAEVDTKKYRDRHFNQVG